MARLTTPLVVLAAVFVAAGGYLHLTEWLDVYRDVPSAVDGAFVVRIGFPVNVALSVLAVVALGVAAWRRPSRLPLVAGVVALFQAGSLVALILSRTGSVLGWSEPTWSPVAEQTRAMEIAALVLLGLVVVMSLALRDTSSDARPS